MSGEWGCSPQEAAPDNLEQLIRLPGLQYDDESGLYYNRNRYYNPKQRRYITQDPIGLRGGLNSYSYPLNPVANIDPLGLDCFTANDLLGSSGSVDWGTETQSLAASVPEQDLPAALHDHAIGAGGWNPGADYVKLWAIDTPVVAGATLTGPVSSLAAYGKNTLSLVEIMAGSASSCAAVATTDYMNGKTPDKSELLLCGSTGAFGAGKSFIEKTLMKMGFSFLSKGNDTQVGIDAAANTGIEEVIGGAAGTLPYVPKGPVGDYVTDTFSGNAFDSVKNKDNTNKSAETKNNKILELNTSDTMVLMALISPSDFAIFRVPVRSKP